MKLQTVITGLTHLLLTAAVCFCIWSPDEIALILATPQAAPGDAMTLHGLVPDFGADPPDFNHSSAGHQRRAPDNDAALE
ncbi:MAG: hypothetical protein ACYTGR_01590 [Planctomycetota bacterium]|jgi:hypothetical protein